MRLWNCKIYNVNDFAAKMSAKMRGSEERLSLLTRAYRVFGVVVSVKSG